MALYGAERLQQVDQRLVSLLYQVAQDHDILVIQGARPYAEELADEQKHASELKNPWDSKHVIGAERVVAEAADVAPYPLNWNDVPAFETLGAAVKSTAQQVGLVIVWGGDWKTLKDYSHYEMA
jgi:peptidoglycan L-alanyl-D-glutamate endopeptidase CwlK